jgi:hypothetical protein
LSDVFISYAAEDRDRVAPIANALESQGWSTFWDRMIPLGKTWREVLDVELVAARCIVVLWSHSSIDSDWVLEEAEEGRERKILIPILIGEVAPPRGFRGRQTANLSNWNGEPEGVEALLADVKRILGNAPENAPEDQDDSVSRRSATHRAGSQRARDMGTKWAKVLAIGVAGFAVAYGVLLLMSQTQTLIELDPTAPGGSQNSSVYSLKNGARVRMIGSIVNNGSNVHDEIVRHAVEFGTWRYNSCYDSAFGQLNAALPEGAVIVGFDILDQLPRNGTLDQTDFSDESFNECILGTLFAQTINAAGRNGTGHVTYSFKFVPD